RETAESSKKLTEKEKEVEDLLEKFKSVPPVFKKRLIPLNDEHKKLVLVGGGGGNQNGAGTTTAKQTDNRPTVQDFDILFDETKITFQTVHGKSGRLLSELSNPELVTRIFEFLDLNALNKISVLSRSFRDYTKVFKAMFLSSQNG
ncbi:unnamed protein product, partial [Amoebophrya sp. A120]